MRDDGSQVCGWPAGWAGVSITERGNTGEYQVHFTDKETGANEVKCQRLKVCWQERARQGHDGLISLEVLLSQGCTELQPWV